MILINSTDGKELENIDDKGFSPIATEASQLLTKYFYACIVLIGIPGNAAVLIVFQGKLMRQSIGHIIILMKSLAFMDFIACSCMLIFNVFPQHLAAYMRLPILCNIFYSSFIFWGAASASGYHMLMIGIERYIAITFPIWHRQNITNRHMYLMCLVSFFVGFVVTPGWIVLYYQYQDGACVFLAQEYTSQYRRISGIITLICIIIVPIPAIVFCYLKIYLTIIKKDIGDASKAVLKTLIITIVAYLICWLPNQITWFLYTQGYEIKLDGAWYSTSVMLVSLNSCLNCIIYFANIKNFRIAVIETLSCGKIKCQRPNAKTGGKSTKR